MADTFNMSNYLESKVYDHLLRSATWSKPTTLAFALCSGVPTSADTGATISEFANANGYARVNYGAPADSGWQVITADNGGKNTLNIGWPACVTSNWGTASGIAICDNSAYGAGNLLMWGQLSTPREIRVGDTPFMGSGVLTITFD